MFVAHIFAALALVIATVVDLKKREVPDTISYGTMAVGVLLGITTTIQLHDLSPFWTMLAGFGLGAGIGLFMFFAGQWGGGDAKLVAGLGALFGWSTFYFNFLILTVFAGAIYGLLYGAYLAWKNKKSFVPAFKEHIRTRPVKIARAMFQFVVALALLLALFVITDFFLRLALVVISAGCYFLFYAWLFAKVLEETCMKKMIPVKELVEGDWILGEVRVGKQTIVPAKFGVTKEQITQLQRSKVKKVLVKEGIPFVPSFLLAYVFALVAQALAFTPF